MAALKRRITIGSKGVAPQRGKGTVATAAAVPKETAGRLDFGRAGLYDDMETPLEASTVALLLCNRERSFTDRWVTAVGVVCV